MCMNSFLTKPTLTNHWLDPRTVHLHREMPSVTNTVEQTEISIGMRIWGLGENIHDQIKVGIFVYCPCPVQVKCLWILLLDQKTPYFLESCCLFYTNTLFPYNNSVQRKYSVYHCVTPHIPVNTLKNENDPIFNNTCYLFLLLFHQ